MTKPRPICVHCGKPYGSRDTTMETVRWPSGDMPAYRGNGIVTKTTMHRSARPAMQLNDPTRGAFTIEAMDNVAYRTIWDGATYRKPYEPFCTLRCALAYARKAYKNRRTK